MLSTAPMRWVCRSPMPTCSNLVVSELKRHNDDGSWQMACLLQRFVQVGWVGASLRQTLGSDCELSTIIAASGTWDVVHSCLWQAEVGTMSLCHGVMPITVDDTFALVSASLSRYR